MNNSQNSAQLSSQQATHSQFSNQFDHGQQQMMNMTGHQMTQYGMNNYHQSK